LLLLQQCYCGCRLLLLHGRLVGHPARPLPVGAHLLGLLSGSSRHAIPRHGLLGLLLYRWRLLLLLVLLLLLPRLQAGVYWRHQGSSWLLLLHGLHGLQPRVC
jgi:hypothetical protein